MRKTTTIFIVRVVRLPPFDSVLMIGRTIHKRAFVKECSKELERAAGDFTVKIDTIAATNEMNQHLLLSRFGIFCAPDSCKLSAKTLEAQLLQIEPMDTLLYYVCAELMR